MSRAAAFFDLDKTLIAKSSSLAFGRPFYEGGLIGRKAIVRTTIGQFLYLLNGADADRMDQARDYLKELCIGWDAQQVADIVAETLHEVVDPLVYDEAVQLIEEHRAAGRDVVIISSSGEDIVRGVAEMVGAQHAIGTRMEVVDGRYTGEIDFYAYGPHKAEAIRELARTEGYDLSSSYAYSDSHTDLPMLEEVGHPVAVNPDKALRRVAVERGWPIRTFTRPVSLRSRVHLPSPSAPVLAGAAVGLGAAALGWRLHLRRRARKVG